MARIRATGELKKPRADAGKTRKQFAASKVATEALRQKVKGFPFDLLVQLSGVSRETISRFRAGENIRGSTAKKLADAIQNYKAPKKVRQKKEAESGSSSERCAYLVDEDGAWHPLGDLDEVRHKEKVICSWCLKAHEGEGCSEEDLGIAENG